MTDPISRASETMARCTEIFACAEFVSRGSEGARQRPAPMAEILDRLPTADGGHRRCRSSLIVVPLLVAVAYLTYAERKVIGAMQLRKGPNVVGPFGLLQPIADGLKLLAKETIIPAGANRVVFVMAPMLTFILALIAWAVIPFDDGLVLADINVGILYLFAISSLGVYGIIMAGWASNSKYAFLGALRSGGADGVLRGLDRLRHHHRAAVRRLAEPVRHRRGAGRGLVSRHPAAPDVRDLLHLDPGGDQPPPFDLPEAEAELVAGYNVEYSSMTFALFFLGEYANMILMSGDDHHPVPRRLAAAVRHRAVQLDPGADLVRAEDRVLLFVFLWVRATFPRYRYDQLMRLGWKVFLPFSLLWVVVTAGLLMAFDWVLPERGEDGERG